jgi:zinc D-Ala-D-Ala dipeptidase
MFLVAADLCVACEPGEDNVARLVPEQQQEVPVTDSLALPADWTEIRADEGFILAMPYADTANFTHRQIYPCARCLLRPEVATALRKAQKAAKAKRLKLVIYDAYRPRPYQQKMYDVVPDKRYVADPAKGSMHNRGAAVDISLADGQGRLLDMGTAFDSFTPLAHYNHPDLSSAQQYNRRLLQELMINAGFEPYSAEWWHFTYRKNDYPLSDYLWPCP